MAFRGKIFKVVCVVSLILLAGLVFFGCNIEEVFENGTLTINISGADAYNGKSFRYYIETFLPADRALDDAKIFTGSEVITAGLINMTLEDPDSLGTPYLFKANNVVSVYGFIDVDDTGPMENGGIDKAMNDMLAEAGSGHINGNKVITAVYPSDFHLSESGSGNITLIYTGSGLMVSRDALVELTGVTAGTPKDFLLSIQNTGWALLKLEGTPLVEISGTTSAPFTVSTQPSSDPVIPDDTAPFTITVSSATSGTYSAMISIPFDDTNIDDPDEMSPYVTTFQVIIP